MEMTIKSRATGEMFNFFMPYGGGYIRLQSANAPGTLGQQICHNGRLEGSTVSANPKTFRNTCQRWYRQYRRAELNRSRTEYCR